MAEFVGYGKTPRLYRDVVITEKLDGTNGCVFIQTAPFGSAVEEDESRVAVVFSEEYDDSGEFPLEEYHVYAQSRNKFITPENDNYNFATWVAVNATFLVNLLGPGRHFGEWWGQGIQRNYGMKRKMFSLFAGTAERLYKRFDGDGVPLGIAKHMYERGVDIVPTLCTGVLSDALIQDALAHLDAYGSQATDFDNPEGIIVYHKDAGKVFKVLLEDDHISKTEAGL